MPEECYSNGRRRLTFADAAASRLLVGWTRFAWDSWHAEVSRNCRTLLLRYIFSRTLPRHLTPRNGKTDLLYENIELSYNPADWIYWSIDPCFSPASTKNSRLSQQKTLDSSHSLSIMIKVFYTGFPIWCLQSALPWSFTNCVMLTSPRSSRSCFLFGHAKHGHNQATCAVNEFCHFS